MLPKNSDHSVPFRVADVWRVIFRWVFLLGNQKERRQNTKKSLQFETSALSVSISLQVIQENWTWKSITKPFPAPVLLIWGHLLERRQKDWGTGSTGQRLGGGASNPTSSVVVASADEKRQAALEAVQRRQVSLWWWETSSWSLGEPQQKQGNKGCDSRKLKLVWIFVRVFFLEDTVMSFGMMRY